MGEESLSSSFSQDSNTQNEVCDLEAVSNDVKISGSEDEQDGCEIGNSGGSRVVPRQKAVEERVIVCEGLTGSSWGGWCRTSSGEVGEFVLCLCGLVLDIGSHRPYQKLLALTQGNFQVFSIHTICDALCNRMVSYGTGCGGHV